MDSGLFKPRSARYNHRLRPSALRATYSLIVLTFATGCTVHFGNRQRGIEHAWGVGRVTWEVEPISGDCKAISSGFRLPGLVLGIGPDFFGVNLGYQVRERIQVLTNAAAETASAWINGHELATDTGSRWGWGHLRLQTPTTRHLGLVTGKAAAGLGLALEGGLPSAAVGWDSRQRTEVGGDDILLELAGGSTSWPHFDFPSTQVAVTTTTNLIGLKQIP